MTPDDFDPARGYDDNPPACLRCDAKNQEIEALRESQHEAGRKVAECVERLSFYEMAFHSTEKKLNEYIVKTIDAEARVRELRGQVAQLRAALEAMVDAADGFSTPDDPKGWAAYTAGREALGVPVNVGTDAFSGREFYESYRCAMRSKPAATEVTR